MRLISFKFHGIHFAVTKTLSDLSQQKYSASALEGKQQITNSKQFT